MNISILNSTEVSFHIHSRYARTRKLRNTLLRQRQIVIAVGDAAIAEVVVLRPACVFERDFAVQAGEIDTRNSQGDGDTSS